LGTYHGGGDHEDAQSNQEKDGPGRGWTTHLSLAQSVAVHIIHSHVHRHRLTSDITRSSGGKELCDSVPGNTSTDDYRELKIWVRMLGIVWERSDSLKARLSNEIQLVWTMPPFAMPLVAEHLQAFNLVAQRDSRSTFQMSLASQKDSTAMRTIAVVTLAFLPATVVSVRLLTRAC
jgi:hypothetical protein